MRVLRTIGAALLGLFSLQACNAHMMPYPPMPPGAQPAPQYPQPQPQPRPQAMQLDGDWQLVSAEGIEARKVHLNLSGTTYGLNAGCNHMRGMFQAGPRGRMTLQPGASTLMGCPDDYEHRFTEVIMSTQAYELSGSHLMLHTRQGRLVFARMQPTAHLEGNWRVAGIYDGRAGVVMSVDQPEQSVQFHPDGRISGHDGCNRIGGQYQVQGENIRITSQPLTRKSCRFTGQAWDNLFHAGLQNTRRIHIAPGRVTLIDGDGSVMMNLQR